MLHSGGELDLVNRMPEELWTEVHNIVQEAVNKTIPKKKKFKNTKWLSEKKRRKENIYLSECRVPNNSKERQESLLK